MDFSQNKKEGTSHLDSHADTSAGGSNFCILDRLDSSTEYVDVSPFSDEYKPIKHIPIASCATAYVSPTTGDVSILVFHQMLYFGDKLKHSLLCPNQIRAQGNIVDDTPRHLSDKSSHSMTFYSEDRKDKIFIPLEIDGVISYVNTMKPTEKELAECPYYIATSATPWDPHSDALKHAEEEYNRAKPRTVSGVEVTSLHSRFGKNTGLAGEDIHALLHVHEIAKPRNLSICSVDETNSQIYRHLVSPDNCDPHMKRHKENRVINAIHTPLYEAPYSDGRGNSELAFTGKNVVNLSAINRGYRADGDYEQKLKEKESVSTTESLDERYVDRRIRWGPVTTAPDTRGGITPKMLAKRFGIGEKRASETIRVTTQRGIRNLTNPLVRRMPTQRWRNKKQIKGKWFSDTMKFTEKSIMRQETAAQVFTNGAGYDEFYPITKESNCSDGLQRLINEVGIPERLVVDGSKAQGSHDTYNTNWQKLTRAYNIQQSWIQPHCWWQNLAEKCIGEIRKDMRRLQSQKQSPKRLWGYLGTYVAGKRQRTASSHPSNMGRTGYEVVTGRMPDITPYIIHDWYECVWWFDHLDKTRKLGRWLGPSGTRWGGGDCSHILYETGKIHITNTTSPLTEEDWANRDIIRRLDEMDNEINRRIGDKLHRNDQQPGQDDFPTMEDILGDEEVLMAEPEASMPDVDDYEFTPEQYDEYIGSEILLPIGTERLRGVVKRRTHDLNGNPIGVRNSNPILDTRKYEVQLPDGSIETFNANILAENIMSSVDDEGSLYVLLDEIIDHKRKNNAMGDDDAYAISKDGTRRRKPTTRGWELLVSWKDGTTSWARLADMKESFPLEVAEYAKGNNIIHEPAFAWWCHKVLRRKKRFIKGAKTRYWLKTHKYGVRLPKTIKEALKIDRETGTDLWAKAIAKEMKNVMVTFSFTEDDRVPVGHRKVTVHMVFDVKITLQRKARLVADGHKVPETAKESTYSSVPSRDSVRLFFLLAALNNLDVLSADIQNAYLTAPIKEKYYVVADQSDGFSSEFHGRPATIVRAMYGLPVAGASFRSYLALHLRELGYKPCKADPDVHMRVAVKKNGEAYYQYMLAYVDDLLCCGEEPKNQMSMIEGKFTLKDGTVEEPTLYLGADIEKVTLTDSEDPSKTRWAMSSTKYTAKAISEVERELGTEKYGYTYLPKGVKTPMAADYRPELDSSPELNHEKQNYYQGLIGILRWICELGRLDIIMPVSLMSRYLAQAREGHMDQVFHMFAYLKEYNRSCLVFDDSLPSIDESRFHSCDWTEFYPGASELIPPDMPIAKGKSVRMTCFVDADHAGCKETRRSHTGIIIFLNRAPILWFSKRQSTVETSTFGSEIVAMRIAIEMIEGLRYKLRMMGVPIDGPCDVFCDNQSVVTNVTRPESPLKKKHNSVAYHKARESIAADTIRIAKEDGTTNIADILTKLLKGPALRDLSARCMWRD